MCVCNGECNACKLGMKKSHIKKCLYDLPHNLSCPEGDVCNYYSSMYMTSRLFILKTKNKTQNPLQFHNTVSI